MKIFTIFLDKILAKIFSKTHQIVPFFKIFLGEHAPEPPCMAQIAGSDSYKSD